MTTAQGNWLANLKALVDEHSEPGNRRPGYRFVSTGADISEEYVYQLYNEIPNKDGTPRVLGPRTAKKMARAFADERPLNWIDYPPGQLPAQAAPQRGAPPSDIVAAVMQLAGALQAASPMARKAVAPILAGVAESPDSWRDATEMLVTLLAPHAPSVAQATNDIAGRVARLLQVISTTPDHQRLQAVINAETAVWDVRSGTAAAAHSIESSQTSLRPIDGPRPAEGKRPK